MRRVHPEPTPAFPPLTGATDIGEITIRKKKPQGDRPAQGSAGIAAGDPVFPIDSINREDQLDSAVSKHSLVFLVAITAAVSACAIGLAIYRVLEFAAKALSHAL